jgi:hypothetical protein
VVAATTAAVVEAVRSWTCGALINFLGHAGPGRVGRIFDDADHARLLQIRRRHDPEGTFSTNIVLG